MLHFVCCDYQLIISTNTTLSHELLMCETFEAIFIGKFVLKCLLSEYDSGLGLSICYSYCINKF